MKTHSLYLNGQWVGTNKSIRVVNPASNEAFAEVCVVDRPAVAQALRDAHAAWAGWRALTGKARGELI